MRTPAQTYTAPGLRSMWGENVRQKRDLESGAESKFLQTLYPQQQMTYNGKIERSLIYMVRLLH